MSISKCVYCKDEIKGNGIYFCDKCKEEIKESSRIQTGDVLGNWIIKCYWYLESNNGNYWKNLNETPTEEKNYQFIRPIDLIRFKAYRESIGVDADKMAMNAENLNKMEEWYLKLAEENKQ